MSWLEPPALILIIIIIWMIFRMSIINRILIRLIPIDHNSATISIIFIRIIVLLVAILYFKMIRLSLKEVVRMFVILLT